jgi:amino acid transporter
VFGWLYLLVTTPAAIAALATFFGELAVAMAHPEGAPPAWQVPVVAGVTIVALSIVNLLGARLGTAVQTFFGVVKVGALLAVIAVSFASAGSLAHFSPSVTGARNLGVGAASVIWAYDGWIAVSMVAGEVVAAEKLMRRIIVGGMLGIVLLYILANLGYFYAMPVDEMARETVGVPQRIITRLFGPLGATLLGGAILCSVFGALNGNILAKPRVAFALARDGLTFGVLGRAHPRWSTPWAAILIHAAGAVLLVALLRDFDRLSTYFVVVEWSALLFAVAAVLVLRRREPQAPRPFRTPAYPWPPLVFLAGTFAGLVAIVWGEIGRPVPNYSPLWGLVVALAGFPVHAAWRRFASPSAAAPRASS